MLNRSVRKSGFHSVIKKSNKEGVTSCDVEVCCVVYRCTLLVSAGNT